MEAWPARPDPLAALVTHERRRRADDAEMLEVLARLDEDWPDDPAIPDLVCELAVGLGVSSSTARERIRIARALRDLPEIALAHREGRLSWDQLRWVTMFATPETDMEWAVRAPRMRPLALRDEFLRQKRVRRAQAERDHAARELHTFWDEEKRFFSFAGTVAAEQGAAFEASLRRTVERIEIDPDADDAAAARRADALLALVTSAGEAAAQPATLVVHADAEVLTGERDGEQHLSETSDGVQLHRDAVRRIACDARVLTALTRNGRAIAIRSHGRTVTPAQMEVLLFRDRGCTYPGCGSRWFLHAHHIRHWADGGKTTLDNLTLLCGSHHRRLHDGGWTIRGRPPDGIEFVSRTGRVFGGAPRSLAGVGLSGVP